MANQTPKTPAEAKKEFIELYQQHIKRPGADRLLAWLESRDFFTAPASTRFHNAFEGGLCMHSLNVFNRLEFNYELEVLKQGGDDLSERTKESLAIVALLHDLCKVDFYTPGVRNVKVYKPNGSKKDSVGNFDWEEEKNWQINEQFYFGHGEKSVFIINQFMPLLPAEAMAIRYHMADFDRDRECTACFNDLPLAAMLHIADMEATYLDERVASKPIYSFAINRGEQV